MLISENGNAETPITNIYDEIILALSQFPFKSQKIKSLLAILFKNESLKILLPKLASILHFSIYPCLDRSEMLEFLESLIERDKSSLWYVVSKHEKIKSDVMHCIDSGNLSDFRILVDSNEKYVFCILDSYENILHRVSRSGYIEILRFILANPSLYCDSLSQQNVEGKTFVHILSNEFDLSTILLVIKSKLPVELTALDHNGRSFLHIIALQYYRKNRFSKDKTQCVLNDTILSSIISIIENLSARLQSPSVLLRMLTEKDNSDFSVVEYAISSLNSSFATYVVQKCIKMSTCTSIMDWCRVVVLHNHFELANSLFSVFLSPERFKETEQEIISLICDNSISYCRYSSLQNLFLTLKRYNKLAYHKTDLYCCVPKSLDRLLLCNSSNEEEDIVRIVRLLVSLQLFSITTPIPRSKTRWNDFLIYLKKKNIDTAAFTSRCSSLCHLFAHFVNSCDNIIALAALLGHVDILRLLLTGIESLFPLASDTISLLLPKAFPSVSSSRLFGEIDTTQTSAFSFSNGFRYYTNVFFSNPLISAVLCFSQRTVEYLLFHSPFKLLSHFVDSWGFCPWYLVLALGGSLDLLRILLQVDYKFHQCTLWPSNSWRIVLPVQTEVAKKNTHKPVKVFLYEVQIPLQSTQNEVLRATENLREIISFFKVCHWIILVEYHDLFPYLSQVLKTFTEILSYLTQGLVSPEGWRKRIVINGVEVIQLLQVFCNICKIEERLCFSSSKSLKISVLLSLCKRMQDEMLHPKMRWDLIRKKSSTLNNILVNIRSWCQSMNQVLPWITYWKESNKDESMAKSSSISKNTGNKVPYRVSYYPSMICSWNQIEEFQFFERPAIPDSNGFSCELPQIMSNAKASLDILDVLHHLSPFRNKMYISYSHGVLSCIPCSIQSIDQFWWWDFFYLEVKPYKWSYLFDFISQFERNLCDFYNVILEKSQNYPIQTTYRSIIQVPLNDSIITNLFILLDPTSLLHGILNGFLTLWSEFSGKKGDLFKQLASKQPALNYGDYTLFKVSSLKKFSIETQNRSELCLHEKISLLNQLLECRMKMADSPFCGDCTKSSSFDLLTSSYLDREQENGVCNSLAYVACSDVMSPFYDSIIQWKYDPIKNEKLEQWKQDCHSRNYLHLRHIRLPKSYHDRIFAEKHEKYDKCEFEWMSIHGRPFPFRCQQMLVSSSSFYTHLAGFSQFWIKFLMMPAMLHFQISAENLSFVENLIDLESIDGLTVVFLIEKFKERGHCCGNVILNDGSSILMKILSNSRLANEISDTLIEKMISCKCCGCSTWCLGSFLCPTYYTSIANPVQYRHSYHRHHALRVNIDEMVTQLDRSLLVTFSQNHHDFEYNWNQFPHVQVDAIRFLVATSAVLTDERESVMEIVGSHRNLDHGLTCRDLLCQYFLLCDVIDESTLLIAIKQSIFPAVNDFIKTLIQNLSARNLEFGMHKSLILSGDSTIGFVWMEWLKSLYQLLSHSSSWCGLKCQDYFNGQQEYHYFLRLREMIDQNKMILQLKRSSFSTSAVHVSLVPLFALSPSQLRRIVKNHGKSFLPRPVINIFDTYFHINLLDLVSSCSEDIVMFLMLNLHDLLNSKDFYPMIPPSILSNMLKLCEEYLLDNDDLFSAVFEGCRYPIVSSLPTISASLRDVCSSFSLMVALTSFLQSLLVRQEFSEQKPVQKTETSSNIAYWTNIGIKQLTMGNLYGFMYLLHSFPSLLDNLSSLDSFFRQILTLGDQDSFEALMALLSSHNHIDLAPLSSPLPTSWTGAHCLCFGSISSTNTASVFHYSSLFQKYQHEIYGGKYMSGLGWNPGCAASNNVTSMNHGDTSLSRIRLLQYLLQDLEQPKKSSLQCTRRSRYSWKWQYDSSHVQYQLLQGMMDADNIGKLLPLAPSLPSVLDMLSLWGCWKEIIILLSSPTFSLGSIEGFCYFENVKKYFFSIFLHEMALHARLDVLGKLQSSIYSFVIKASNVSYGLGEVKIVLSTLFSSTRRLDYDFSSNKVEDFDTTNWLRKIGHSLSRYVQCQWGFEATLSPWDNLLGVRRHCLLHDAILSGNEDFVLHMVKIFALFDSEELASPLTNIDGQSLMSLAIFFNMKRVIEVLLASPFLLTYDIDLILPFPPWCCYKLSYWDVIAIQGHAELLEYFLVEHLLSKSNSYSVDFPIARILYFALASVKDGIFATLVKLIKSYPSIHATVQRGVRDILLVSVTPLDGLLHYLCTFNMSHALRLIMTLDETCFDPLLDNIQDLYYQYLDMGNVEVAMALREHLSRFAIVPALVQFQCPSDRVFFAMFRSILKKPQKTHSSFSRSSSSTSKTSQQLQVKDNSILVPAVIDKKLKEIIPIQVVVDDQQHTITEKRYRSIFA